MSGRIIAIGDIHGCATALRTLLETIVPAADDLFVPLGDYVDRGPDSRGVIEQLVQLAAHSRVEPIRGNHEEMMLAVIEQGAQPHAWLQYGGIDTLDSYGFGGNLNVVPESHREFLRSCRDFVETDTHFFVHGNYLHDQPLSEQSAEVLRWTSLDQHMPRRHVSQKVAVVGHTPDKTGEILSLKHLVCIDTYCYGGRWLTALDVTTGRIWQANNAGELRT